MKLAFWLRTLWLHALSVIKEWPSSWLSHNVAGFLDAVGEALDVKTAPFLSAFMITWCYRSGFQSSSSERQRERNSRSPFAALLYFNPRHVSKAANRLRGFFPFCGVLCLFVLGLLKLLFRRMTIWRTILKGKRLTVFCLPGQPLIRPLRHNNS